MTAAAAKPVTVERLERGLLMLAHIIRMDGDVYLPIFARLEQELEVARRQQDTMARALSLIDSYKIKSAGATKAIR